MNRLFFSALRLLVAFLLLCGVAAATSVPRSTAVGWSFPQKPLHSFRLLAEGLPFVIIRPSGRIVMASRSARRLLGLGTEGGNLLTLTEGTDAHAAIRRAVNHPFERMETFCIAFPGTEGEERRYRMDTSPMGGGGATGIILKDITNATPYTRAALNVARMAVTAGSMAGPLSVLSGWLETAQETEEVLSPAVLRAMGRQVALLKKISAELGAEQGGAPSHLLLGEFDLLPIVQDAADELAARMVKTGSHLEFHYSETPFIVHGDSLLWQQLTGELLGSTLLGDEARRLRFTAERMPTQLVIEIESDGPARWEMPRRLELVRSAVRAQHGEFACEELAPQGVRYTLRFPI